MVLCLKAVKCCQVITGNLPHKALLLTSNASQWHHCVLAAAFIERGWDYRCMWFLWQKNVRLGTFSNVHCVCTFVLGVQVEDVCVGKGCGGRTLQMINGVDFPQCLWKVKEPVGAGWVVSVLVRKEPLTHLREFKFKMLRPQAGWKKKRKEDVKYNFQMVVEIVHLWINHYSFSNEQMEISRILTQYH